MRTLLISFYLFSFLLTNHEIYQSTNIDDFKSDVQTLSNYFEAKQIEFDSFEFTIRADLDQSQVKKLEKMISEKKFSKDLPKKNMVNEEFSVTNFDQRSSVQVTYVISGTTWNEDTKKAVLTKVTSPMFTELFKNGHFYSCFQSTNNANISSNLFFDRMREDFAINNENLLNEPNFKVLGGKSDRLNSSLNDNENSINIQLSIREEADGTTLTIGTPILVIEY